MTDELLPATRAALLRRVAAEQRTGRAPSLVGAVVRDGELAWFGATGTVGGVAPTSDTQYRIGSLSKTFTAVLVLRLRDEGLLALTDPLAQHLPGTRVGDLRIGELLAHTAGLASETPPPWWERTAGTVRPGVADMLWARPDPHPPGRTFHYSNPGFGLLGALVAQVRGVSWDEVLQREILDPLGMSRTTLMPAAPHAYGYAVHPWADLVLPEPTPHTELMAPAGQIWSTAEDIARFARFLADGDGTVLATTSVGEMRAPASPPSGDAWESGYGLGMQLARVEGHTLVGHTGSMPGFVASLWLDVDDALAGIAFANATSGPAVPVVAADLITIVREQEPRLPVPWQPLTGFDPELLELTGPWYWGAAPFALKLTADRGLELVALGGRGRVSRFAARHDGSWLGRDGYYDGEVLTVVRSADGTVTHLDIGSFVFTRGPYDPAGPVPGGVDDGGWRPGPV